MAIKISGTTVIDDSRNIVNGVGVNISGVATATSFDGSGASLTSLSADNISSGTLAIARGGTNTSSTPTSGGITYGNGSAYAFTSAGTSGQVFTSNGTSAPTWEDPAAGGGGGDFNTNITSATGYLVTTSMATAYTAPATSGRYIIKSIHVTNIDGTASADISGQLYGTTSFAHTVPVPAGSSVELLKQPKVLSDSQTIQLQASASSHLHATITVEPQAGDTTYVGAGVDITSASTYTDLWTATGDAVLQSVLLANDDGDTDVKARVVWTNGSNTIQGYYAYDMTIPADATVEILEQPKFLESGYKVRVYANQANRLEAILAAKTI